MLDIIAKLETPQKCQAVEKNAIRQGRRDLAIAARKRALEFRARAYNASNEVERKCLEGDLRLWAGAFMDYLDFKQPIALSNSDELFATPDNEALLTKFMDVNAKFIEVGPLHQQFQKLEYSQLRDELRRIDVEIRHRALLGTPEYKAAVKAVTIRHGSSCA
jgi:hypothetical protein